MSEQIPDPKKREDSDRIAEISSRFSEFLTQFESWVDTRRVAQVRKGRLFDYCVKSSLAKVFDFGRGMISLESSREQIPAYFVSGSLRGICEDVIILCYLSEKPNNLRDPLLSKWIVYEQHRRRSSQERFFSSNHRSFQNVLTLSDDAKLEKQANDLRIEWRKLGWRNLGENQTSPSTRAIAKKAGILDIYDFFYRFACDLVHFNPGILLRFGWGDLNLKKIKFSASNFNEYYLVVGLVYGAYFWCLTLHLLRKSHRMPKELRSVEKEMIKWLFRIERWPEMITPEELNISPPKNPVLNLLMRGIMQIQLSEMPSRLLTRKRKQ